MRLRNPLGWRRADDHSGRFREFTRELDRRRGELPTAVHDFYRRATEIAADRAHRWAVDAATRADDLVFLIELGRGARTVVELGTGPAWTAIALAIAEPGRRVISYDPVVHEHRDEYLRLAPPDAAERIEFVQAPGGSPRSPTGDVELLFIDSLHQRDATVAEFEAWRDRLRPGATVVFHDYGHPQFPGVAEAVSELGLEGEVRGGMFVWRAPSP